jgi:hypothetical protein
MQTVWIPLGDALTVIAEHTCTDLTTAAERFRAAAYAGEIEVRARPGLFTDHRAGIPGELFAEWRAGFVDQPPYGFHVGAQTHWYDAEVRGADIEQLKLPEERRGRPGGPAGREAQPGKGGYIRGHRSRAASEDEDGATGDPRKRAKELGRILNAKPDTAGRSEANISSISKRNLR